MPTSTFAMNIHWDFKVIADSQGQVADVFQKIIAEMELDVKSHEITEYPKFTTRLFTLLVDSQMDGRTAGLTDVANLFGRLGTPIFVDKHSRDGLECYEAMFDSRKHLVTIPDVFWARVYAEKRIPKTSAESHDIGITKP